jgi:chorismate lyase
MLFIIQIVFGTSRLIALKTNRYHPAEDNWQDFHRYTACELPSQIRPWLLDSGSLTRRLIKSSHGNFSVEILKQQWQRPRLSEAQLLDMAPREMAIIREVALLCHGQPWVFARSVIPASSLQGHLRRLRKFDNSSLGAMLFSDPSMHRAPFQLAKLNGFNHQLPQNMQQDAELWGRRSRFELGGKPIMVSEIFLQAFKP